MPLGTVIADFLAEHKGATNPKTWDTTESNLRLHVPERLKRLPIRAVSVGNLESAYMTALKEPLARSTVNRVRNDFSIVFAWAVRHEIITENTVTKSRVPAGAFAQKLPLRRSVKPSFESPCQHRLQRTNSMRRSRTLFP